MAEWPWWYRSRSKIIVCHTLSHASDHLCLIWKVSVKNCRSYRADTECGTDGRNGTKIPPTHPTNQLHYKKRKKNKHKKWGYPLSHLVLERSNSISVYNSSKTYSLTHWNRATYYNYKTNLKKGEKIKIENDIRKATLNSTIFEE